MTGAKHAEFGIIDDARGVERASSDDFFRRKGHRVMLNKESSCDAMRLPIPNNVIRGRGIDVPAEALSNQVLNTKGTFL